MLRIYFKYLKVFLRQKMEFRTEFFFDLLASSFNVFNYYFGIIILFENFNNIHGWNYNEVVFLFSFNWLSMSISSLFFWAPMKNMGNYVRSGEFDCYLFRPVSPLFHVIAKQFQYTFLARLAIAVVLCVHSIMKLDIEINMYTVFLIVLFTICGCLVHTGILIALGASSFYIVENSNLVNTVINRDSGIKSFIDYPISIFNNFVQILLTFIVPFAFVNYYPATVLLDKPCFFGSNTILVIPLASILVVVVSSLLWVHGMNRYSSSGF